MRFLLFFHSFQVFEIRVVLLQHARHAKKKNFFLNPSKLACGHVGMWACVSAQ